VSDQWFFSAKTLGFALFLALESINVKVQTMELVTMDDRAGPSPEQVVQMQAVQDVRDLDSKVRDNARMDARAEVAENAPRDSPQVPLREVAEGFSEISHSYDELTRDEAKEKRDSPELGAARNEALKELMATQEKQRAAQAGAVARQETQLKETYKDSPDELQEHLKALEKTSEALGKALTGLHETQLKQFEKQWEQKSQQIEKQPQVMPVNPNRDNR
jgi:Mg2+ and Co2+ transporter CorA